MATAALGPTNRTGEFIKNFDPVMGKMERRKKQYWSGGRGARKQWMKKNESK